MQIRFALLLVLGVLLFSVFACNTADTERMPGVEYEARPKNWPIDVFIDPKAPPLLKDSVGAKHLGIGPADAEFIGEFTSEQVDYTSSRAAPLKRAIGNAKVEARAIGGDAIVITRGRANLDGTSIKGDVLRYKEKEKEE